MERDFFGLSSKNGAGTTMKEDAANKTKDPGSVFFFFFVIFPHFFIEEFAFLKLMFLFAVDEAVQLENFALA